MSHGRFDSVPSGFRRYALGSFTSLSRLPTTPRPSLYRCSSDPAAGDTSNPLYASTRRESSHARPPPRSAVVAPHIELRRVNPSEASQYVRNRNVKIHKPVLTTSML